jgi:squalene-hopene/tetraprenyl-beta-curcumene cyclase
MPRSLARVALFALPLLLASHAFAIDDAHWKKANDALAKGIVFLRTTQAADGSWTSKPGPAITALVVSAMLDRPDIKSTDPAVQKALAYILSKRQPDGGIHDGMLENYNTAICLSALARVNDRPDIAAAIKPAQDYLRGLQWHDQKDPAGNPITEAHAFYGGAGYGL